MAVDALARLRFPKLIPFTPHDLLERRARERGVPGCRKVERAVALADPLAESPMETRLRLLLVLAGLPTPVSQHGEFTHDDHYRDAVTGDLGWHTMRFGYRDVMVTPRRTADLVARMLRRRRASSTAE